MGNAKAARTASPGPDGVRDGRGDGVDPAALAAAAAAGAAVERDLLAEREPVEPSRGVSLSSSAAIHLSVLNTSYDRMHLLARSLEMGP